MTATASYPTLRGRVAIVTGGGRGLGSSFVRHFAEQGAIPVIAERNGDYVGSVMLVKDSETVARIRLLLVDPKARGLGLGTRLTSECIAFARAANYRKITLWTHRNLKAARHIYEKAGFKLIRTERHKSWSQTVVSEHWDLAL